MQRTLPGNNGEPKALNLVIATGGLSMQRNSLLNHDLALYIGLNAALALLIVACIWLAY